MEEQIEEERRKLPSEGLTPVTLASFNKWKEDRARRKQEELEKKMAAEVAQKGVRGAKGIMSGKALFTYDPTLFMDDDGAADDKQYEEDSDGEQLAPVEESKEEAMEESKEQDDNNGKEPEVDEELFKEGAAEEEDVDFD